jgi:predicted nucleic acid-binding protein
LSDLLLDAGVWLAGRDADDRFHAECRELIASPPRPLAALDLTLYEVANVAAYRWGAPREAERLVELILLSCGDRVVRAGERLLERTIAAASRWAITVYDAAHVAWAEDDSSNLVSTDLRDLVRPGLAISPADALA